MTPEEFKALGAGDRITSRETFLTYTVVHNSGHEVTAVKTVVIGRAARWDLWSKAPPESLGDGLEPDDDLRHGLRMMMTDMSLSQREQRFAGRLLVELDRLTELADRGRGT